MLDNFDEGSSKLVSNIAISQKIPFPYKKLEMKQPELWGLKIEHNKNKS